MELSKSEQQIIEILREIKPFEEILIVKDQTGKIGHYFVKRTQKVVIKPEYQDLTSRNDKDY